MELLGVEQYTFQQQAVLFFSPLMPLSLLRGFRNEENENPVFLEAMGVSLRYPLLAAERFIQHIRR
jgi:hypothetical protein